METGRIIIHHPDLLLAFGGGPKIHTTNRQRDKTG